MTTAATTWRPIPAKFIDPNAVPFGITPPEETTPPEELKLDARQELALATIWGKPWELTIMEERAEFSGYYTRQFSQLTPKRNSMRPERHLSATEMNRVRGTLNSYLRHYSGWYQAGWRVRTIQRHPEDGLQRVWIAPVAEGSEE